MAKSSSEELTCPECGFVAKNANGLRGHRQFKHGVLSSSAQQRSSSVPVAALEQRLTALEQRVGEPTPSKVRELLGIPDPSLEEDLRQLFGRVNALEHQEH